MLLAAFFGGMCIASSSTTAVHALAYPLGGKYHIPHGLSNAVLLPLVMEFNLDATEEKFCDIAGAMGIDAKGLPAGEAAKKLIDELYSLVADLQIKESLNLKERGITIDDIDVRRGVFTFRMQVRPDAANIGGLTIFGKGFGDYDQDILMQLYYSDMT